MLVVRTRSMIWLRITTVFWLAAGIISLSFLMYMELMALGRLKNYIPHSRTTSA